VDLTVSQELIMTASTYESLSHSKWDCKYHLVFIPKYRKKVLYGQIGLFLGPVFRELAHQRECEIIEGHMVRIQGEQRSI